MTWFWVSAGIGAAAGLFTVVTETTHMSALPIIFPLMTGFAGVVLLGLPYLAIRTVYRRVRSICTPE